MVTRLAPNHDTSLIQDMRQNANTGENSCLSTALKVAATVAGLGASVGSFALFGPVVGLIVTLISGSALMLLWGCGSSSPHPQYTSAPGVVYVPWYQRVFPTYSWAPAPAPQHVPVGVGRAYAPPVVHDHPPATPWYQRVFSAFPSGTFNMNNNPPHVPVGVGHGRSALPPPSGPGGHVPVGVGHARAGGGNPPPPGRGVPVTLPPPSGPTGHVPVGAGRDRHRH